MPQISVCRLKNEAADQALNPFISQYDVGISSAPSALARAVLFF
jgi:hypothetical protein